MASCRVFQSNGTDGNLINRLTTTTTTATTKQTSERIERRDAQPRRRYFDINGKRESRTGEMSFPSPPAGQICTRNARRLPENRGATKMFCARQQRAGLR
jgi:hypothetical protein